MNGLWPVLAAGSVPAILGFVANYIINKRTLAAASAKSDAEVIDLNIRTQNTITERIEADNIRLANRLAKVEADLAEAREQNDLMVENTRRAQAEARAGRARADRAEEHIQTLTRHIRELHVWIEKYAKDHPPPSEPPPAVPLLVD